MTRRKTGGRELATVLLLFLCYLAWEGDNEQELEYLALPFVTFAIYAYGSKFIKNNPDQIARAMGRGQVESPEHPPEGNYEK